MPDPSHPLKENHRSKTNHMLTPVIPVGGCLYVSKIGNEWFWSWLMLDYRVPSSSLVKGTFQQRDHLSILSWGTPLESEDLYNDYFLWLESHPERVQPNIGSYRISWFEVKHHHLILDSSAALCIPRFKRIYDVWILQRRSWRCVMWSYINIYTQRISGYTVN